MRLPGYPARALLAGLVFCPIMLGQRPQGAYVGAEPLDKEAQATDPAGIRFYSRDLIEGLIPATALKGWPPRKLDSATRKLVDSLTDRLAKAEQAAREGKGKLVPESDVVRAFNDLMRRTGASSSYMADEANVHGYRVHAAELRILPALLTADRNGSNCSPAEAVYLVSELITGNGSLQQNDLNALLRVHRAMDDVRQGRSEAFVTSGAASSHVQLSDLRSGAASRIFNYSAEHHHETSRIFNDFAKTLQF